MTFKDKRDLWYISGNKDKGDIFAIPVTEIGEEHQILTNGIARLADSDIDGARRWIVIGRNGEEAVRILKTFCQEENGGKRAQELIAR